MASTDQMIATSRNRTYSADSIIASPAVLRRMVRGQRPSGHIAVFPPDWLSSDRPPLQIGYVLSQRVFGWDTLTELHYQVLGVVLQQLWIVGLWALLLVARVERTTRGLVIGAAFASDVAIVNAFFVWPKLLAASFLLVAVALVISPDWPRLRRDPRGAALFASLLALFFLTHGSSIFGVVPLAAVAVFRGLPSWRWIGVAAIAAVMLVSPWSAFQRFEDPLGNRLLKWHLAGVPRA